MSSDRSWITAAEAARALQVTPATLYAYVSRGYIRSERKPGSLRERRYSRDDVERMRRRTEGRRDPDSAAAHALQWGMPILESAITLIADNRLYYRGYDAVELARSRSVAEVASLIWTGRFETSVLPLQPAGSAPLRDRAAPRGRSRRARQPGHGLTFVARAQSLLAVAAGDDPHAFDLRPESVAATGWRILNLLAITAAGVRHAPTIDLKLARAWGVRADEVDVLRAALILCADHELNVSSFTARCAASSGSSAYGAVIAGLAALEGTRHGGMSVRVESLLAALRRRRDLPAALGERLRRGESIDGFGHPLYRDGDPRASALLSLLRERRPRSAELKYVLQVAAAAASVIREQPTIDFALAAVARVLHLPPGTPLVLFALGRTIGWIGHAIEQYSTGQLIRPRARYVGPDPVAPGARQSGDRPRGSLFETPAAGRR